MSGHSHIDYHHQLNDIDYIGIGNLAVGDIVTVSTTPLDDVKFEDPDTMIGLFTSGGSRECENDDSTDRQPLCLCFRLSPDKDSRLLSQALS